jgi:hypothetical protein
LKKNLSVLIFAILFISFTSISQKKPVAPKVLNSIIQIDSIELKADEKFLASDELEGRETGERGLNIAALFLKTQFEKIGLKSINNSYFQKFYVIKTSPPKNPSLTISTAQGSIEAEYKKDFFPISTGKSLNEARSQIVFVGYGITSPENNYDDYKNIDVKDKIVLILTNSPRENDYNSPFGGIKKSEPYKNYNSKIDNAIKHGALAVLYMMETEKRTLNLYIKSFGRMLDRPNHKVLNENDKESIPFAYISKDFADKILFNNNQTIDIIKNKIDSSFTPYSFQIKNTSGTFIPNIRREILLTKNVLGYIPGSDSVLKDQFVVFSCHYDHLGKTEDGRIFNGADDNASGTTAILEIAKSYIKNKVKHLRSILFLAFTGEEKGLFGSTYYSDHPLIPFKDTYIDLNIDMIGRIDEKYTEKNKVDYIYTIGPKIMGGDLPEITEECNKESVNLKIDPLFDDIKDPNIFYRRSDHYNFAKHNIPSIFYFGGEHKDYHKTTDKVEKINFGLFKKRVELIAYTGLKFANLKNQIKTERAFP